MNEIGFFAIIVSIWGLWIWLTLIYMVTKIINPIRQMSWISVDDDLPKKDGLYLCSCDGEIKIIRFESGSFTDGYLASRNRYVQAWMPSPVPVPYKKESEKSDENSDRYRR